MPQDTMLSLEAAAQMTIRKIIADVRSGQNYVLIRPLLYKLVGTPTFRSIYLCSMTLSVRSVMCLTLLPWKINVGCFSTEGVGTVEHYSFSLPCFLFFVLLVVIDFIFQGMLVKAQYSDIGLGCFPHLHKQLKFSMDYDGFFGKLVMGQGRSNEILMDMDQEIVIIKCQIGQFSTFCQ